MQSIEAVKLLVNHIAETKAKRENGQFQTYHFNEEYLPFVLQAHERLTNGEELTSEEETLVQELFDEYSEVIVMIEQLISSSQGFSQAERQAVLKTGKPLSKESTCETCGGKALITLYPHHWNGRTKLGIRGRCQDNHCFSMMS